MAQSAPPTPVHHVLIAERARRHRRQPTVEEAALWQALRGGRLGVRFVRQHVLGPYIADFAAVSVRVIVEVDGGYHQRQRARDARRDRRLARWGWRVVHVGAREVMRDLPGVVERIRGALAAQRRQG